MSLDFERLRDILPYSVIVFAGYALYRAYTYVAPATFLHKLPGPRNGHFLLGNLPEIAERLSGDVHERWEEEYGHVLSYRGFLRQPVLMLTDLRALSHVLNHTEVYHKPGALTGLIKRMLGSSILVAEDEVHRAQRKVLNPAFGPARLRDQTGVFLDKANELKNVLSAAARPSSSACHVDMLEYVTQVTLDIIGLAGFGYEFNALAHGSESDELSRACSTVMNSFTVAPISSILSTFLPGFALLPTKQNIEVRASKEIMYRIGSQLFAERKANALLEAAQGEKIAHTQSRDLLSLLVRANMAADPRERMSDEDVLSQIPTFLMAGHETSSTVMCWLLLELASNPSTQASLRAECRVHPLPTLSQGSEPLDAAELSALDKLPLLDAVIRETMRVHSPAPCVQRTAVKNDVIPLARPFVDRDGVLRESITINKGDAVYISISTVDRLVELWGPDAKEWKPERWLGEQGRNDVPDAVKGVPGVWGNMLAFLGGGRACIGFRFSLYEVKILLHTLVTTLSFELSRPREDYVGHGEFLQHVMIKGEVEKGQQLPLLVRLLEEA